MSTRPPALVTGAAGFIGAHLAAALTSDHERVRALDVTAGAGSDAHPGIDAIQGDIRDAALVREALRGVDTVFHLASVHLEVHSSEDEFRAVNVEAVEALVRLAAEAGVRRFVHTSSVGIFGHVEDPPAAEDAPKRPRTPYERTKLAGEAAALEAGERAGIEVVVVRPAWVYGPGCPRTAKLVGAIRARRFFYVGDGSNLRHPVHIDDTVRGLRSARDASSGAVGRPYNLAGPEYLTLRAMVDTVARVVGAPAPRLSVPRVLFSPMATAAEGIFGLLGRHPPFSRRSLAFFENDNAFDTSAAERDLGFRPEIGFEEGLKRTLAHVG